MVKILFKREKITAVPVRLRRIDSVGKYKIANVIHPKKIVKTFIMAVLWLTI